MWLSPKPPLHPSTALVQAVPFPISSTGLFSRDYYFGRVLSSALPQGAVRRALLSSAGSSVLASGGAALPPTQQPLLHKIAVSECTHHQTAPRLSRQVAEELWAGEAELSKGHSPAKPCS